MNLQVATSLNQQKPDVIHCRRIDMHMRHFSSL